MENAYFKGKNVLITGITGFLGSHLAKRLSRLGANVYGTSRSSENENIYKIDILDFTALENLFREKHIEICFHLAAESSVEAGKQDPYMTLKVNVLGTLNILEIARKLNVEKVIITSTSHVYGDNMLPYLEEYPPRPTRPYETSKTCTDIIAQSYADSFNLPVLIPRFVNVYGPGDHNFNRLIPKTIRSVLQDAPPKMWGGLAVRDYLFVEDAINAFLVLAQHNVPSIKSNRIFNFGGGNKISVEDLIQKIIVLSGKKIQIQKIPVERSDEITQQYVSWDKSEKTLHWKPRVSLDDGLKKTIDWYKEYLTKATHNV